MNAFNDKFVQLQFLLIIVVDFVLSKCKRAAEQFWFQYNEDSCLQSKDGYASEESHQKW